MIKTIYITVFLSLNLFSVLGQTNFVISDNSNVSNLEKSYLVVKGNIKIKNNSSINNKGEIDLTKDWINNSGGTSFTNPQLGNVKLNGENQNINGVFETEFHNLQMENGVKTAQLNYSVNSKISISDCELQTLGNLVTLSNPNPNALVWNNGYISSTNLGGYFIRSTNSLSVYQFPVGSSNLENTLRAVEITPTTTDSSSFGVRLAGINPSIDAGVSAAGTTAPFNTVSIASNIDEVNNTFYHNVNRFYGTTEAKTSIYFFDSDEGIFFTGVGKWNSTEQEWQDNDFTIIPVPNIVSEYNIPNKIATSNNVMTYEDDVYSLLGVELIFPTAFTPNNDGINDFFEIEYLEQFPDNELTIYNRWGEQIYQSKPYLNDWNGVNNGTGVKLLGDNVPEDTYFYVLILNEKTPPIKNYIELVRN